MKTDTLTKLLDDMTAETRRGELVWTLSAQTTEDLDPKFTRIVADEDGKEWKIDECYTEFSCTHAGEPFCLISYEMIQTHDKEIRTNNLLFLPPDGMHRFQLDYLAPYSIENNAVLSNHLHTLWVVLTEEYKKGNPKIAFRVTEPTADEL